MNIALILYIIGRVLQIEAVFLLPSCVVALCYGEWQGWIYLAVAAGAAAVERLEEAAEVLRRDARAGVAERDREVAVVGRERDREAAALAHRLDGVLDEVEEDLLQLRGVAGDRREARGRGDVD